MKRRDEDHYGQRPGADAQLRGTMFDGNAALELTESVRRVPVAAHMRTVAGGPLPREAEKKDEVLAKHEADAAKREAIVYLRARLLELHRTRCLTNPDAEVNADDADDILQRWAQCPPVLRTIPKYWKGSIFSRGWERTGRSSPSKRNHGTSLPGWRPRI